MTNFMRHALPLIFRCAVVLMVCTGSLSHAQSEQKLNYQQSLKALKHADPERRIVGMQQLLKLGAAKDASAVYPLLGAPEPEVRNVALGTVWQLWGRSGDAAIDKLYQLGLDHMKDGDAPQAIKVFSDIIAKRPAFAEAWNKRATVYYMMGEHDASIKDCEEVLKLLPQHFGALVGYAQMLAERSQPEKALELMQRASKVNPYLANAEFMMSALQIQIENKRKNMI